MNSERIYAFDFLRSSMMLLGIVLHTSLTFIVMPLNEQWLFKDPIYQSFFFDVFCDFIHTFRMPIFFYVSGFFTALLYFKKGKNYVLKHRFKRIALPFIVFLIILLPITNIISAYSLANLSNIKTSISQAIIDFKIQDFELHTMHLWFLYYLTLICFLFIVSATFLKIRSSTLNFVNKFRNLLNNNIYSTIFFSSFLCTLSLLLMRSPFAITPTTLVPNLTCLFYFSVFFGFGWFAFLNQKTIKTFSQKYKTALSIGFVAYFLKIAFITNIDNSNWHLFLTISNAVAVCSLTLGIIGWFYKSFNFKNKAIKYITDASYWVYLIHMPIVIYFPAFFHKHHFGFIPKYFFTIIFTYILCFSSYHFLVRNTIISRFLSGSKK